MEAEMSTATLESKLSDPTTEKQPGTEKQPSPEKHEASKDAPKGGSGGGSGDGGKPKDAKPAPAPERKKAAKLSEDKIGRAHV